MMTLRNTLSAATATAAACILCLACSSTPKQSSADSGIATPNGTTPTTNTGLTGCTSLQPGCFTAGAATYKTPSVSATCSGPGAPASGPADEHCKGVTPQEVDGSACGVSSGYDGGPTPDAGPPGPCGENGPDYAATMYGQEGDDDDCKYHVTYTYTPICENDGTYFIVTAHYLTRDGAPLEHACTYAELCYEKGENGTGSPPPNVDERPAPGTDGQQLVVEGPPGTYTIGPVIFDEAGEWTVRFHFNEICCDVLPDSPHGHAAFHINVP
jgi:hypothetical protein